MNDFTSLRKELVHLTDYIYSVGKELRAYHDFRVRFDMAKAMFDTCGMPRWECLEEMDAAQKAYNKALGIKPPLKEKKEETTETLYYGRKIPEPAIPVGFYNDSIGFAPLLDPGAIAKPESTPYSFNQDNAEKAQQITTQFFDAGNLYHQN